MKSYRELIVWQQAVLLTEEIYRVTALFPKSELFGLVSQMRRAVISIVSNVAEGFARKSRKENAQFVAIAYGSATELEAQIIVAKKLRFTHEKEWQRAEELLAGILRMLYRLRESLLTNTNG